MVDIFPGKSNCGALSPFFVSSIMLAFNIPEGSHGILATVQLFTLDKKISI